VISFVIPSYTKTDAHFRMLFHECIDSLIRHHPECDQYEIIVCEDGGAKSQDVQRECERRGILSVVQPQNGGFSKNVNAGMRRASGDVIVLVNNDIQFNRPVIEPIRESFKKDERIGIVGALLFYPHGTIQHGGIILHNQTFTHRGWHASYMQVPEVQRPGFLIGCTGALLALKREMIEEIGFWNENYFLSCEDTEYCLRAWSAGWRVFYTPDVSAVHAEGHTRGRTDDEKLKYHREWFVKELETHSKFQADLSKFNLPEILKQVNQANEEMTPVALQAHSCDRMVFQGAGLVAEKKQRARRILIRRTGALGDTLLSTGVIRLLRKNHPQSEIIVATHCGEVLRGNPHVSQVVRSIEGVEADEFYDLDLAYEKNPKIPIWDAYSQVVFGESVLDASFIEMHSTELDDQTARSKLGSMDPSSHRIALVHMGVGWASRTWERRSWNQVIARLARDFKIIVVGRGGDFRAEPQANVLNLVDHLSVFEVRELAKRASVFIGMDSGMLHVAQTTDVPIVGIFTVANPAYRVIPRAVETVALVPKTECRFCLHEQTPPVTFVECRYRTNHCLAGITPDDVVAEAHAIARSF